jgi:hypothetical protein
MWLTEVKDGDPPRGSCPRIEMIEQRDPSASRFSTCEEPLGWWSIPPQDLRATAFATESQVLAFERERVHTDNGTDHALNVGAQT